MDVGQVELNLLPTSNKENLLHERLQHGRDSQLGYSNDYIDETSGFHNQQDVNTISCHRNGNILHSLSGLYAEMLVVIAGISVFTELLHGPVPLLYIHGYLFVYLLTAGILFLIVAYGIKMKSRPVNLDKETTKEDKNFSSATEDISDLGICFKIGAVVFGSCLFASSLLESITVFIAPDECLNISNVAQPLLRAIFTILQVAFFVLNSKNVVASFGCLQNLAVMHLLSTNAAIWIRMLLWESAKDWEDALHIRHNSTLLWEQNEVNVTIHTLDSDVNSIDVSKHYPTHVVRYSSNCWWRIQEFEDLDIVAIQNCLQSSMIGSFWAKMTRFLYPFMSQYCLIVACVLYMIWTNFKSDNLKHIHQSFVHFKINRNDRSHYRSSKGMFLGSLIFLTTVIIMIIFFAMESKDLNISLRSMYCTIYGLSTFSAVLGLVQIQKMSAERSSCNKEFIKLIQSVGILAIYVFGSCNLIVGCFANGSLNFLISLEAVLMIVQASAQYLFIIQISEKRTDPSNFDEKPGRQIVVFLALCNLSLWLLECFVSWNHKSDLQFQVYGVTIWQAITRIVIPFVAFYRYHSIAVLLDAWRMSYR